jgi:hypothetical protein
MPALGGRAVSSIGDMFVVDFSSLLMIPALQTHRAEIEFCDPQTVKTTWRLPV